MSASPVQREQTARVDASILTLRAEGLSYSQIMAATGLPKARVANAVRRAGQAGTIPAPRPLVLSGVPLGAAGIRLDDGSVALIDEASASGLNRCRWRRDTNGYAVRSKRGGAGSLAREVLGSPPGPGLFVDHINGDRLDNRRENLRWSTPKQNSRNGKQRSSIQPFKGVSVEPSAPHLWRARICVDGKLLNLGRFDDPVTAAQAYDAAAIVHFGAFARPNFPGATATPPPKRAQVLARGERVASSKLTVDLVLSARRRHRSGETMYRIAKDLGVDFNTIRKVVRGETWAHVSEAA